MPDHSSFSKNRHGRFRDSDLFRHFFESVLARCIAEGLVGGDGFAVDASLIKAEASRYTKVEGKDRSVPETVTRATRKLLDTLDHAAFGGATPVRPKTLSPTDPAARFTGANGDRAFFAHSTNYLVDLENAVIVDVEATAPIRQADAGAAQTMIERARIRFGLYPERLAADTAYGSAEMLGWLVEDEGIEPHIPVFDKSERKDRAFPATDSTYDHNADHYTGPGGKLLKPYWRQISKDRSDYGKDGCKQYFARNQDCAVRPLKLRGTPNQPTRKISRSKHKGARQMAATSARPTLMSPPTMRARKSRCCSHTSSASSAATVSASEDQTAPETSSTLQRWSRPCESSPGWSPNQHELDQSPEVHRQIDSAFH